LLGILRSKDNVSPDIVSPKIKKKTFFDNEIYDRLKSIANKNSKITYFINHKLKSIAINIKI
jgi:hypothetical protein